MRLQMVLVAGGVVGREDSCAHVCLSVCLRFERAAGTSRNSTKSHTSWTMTTKRSCFSEASPSAKTPTLSASRDLAPLRKEAWSGDAVLSSVCGRPVTSFAACLPPGAE